MLLHLSNCIEAYTMGKIHITRHFHCVTFNLNTCIKININTNTWLQDPSTPYCLYSLSKEEMRKRGNLAKNFEMVKKFV